MFKSIKHTKKAFRIAGCVLICLFWFSDSHAQVLRANHWAFPYGNGLDFSTDPPSPTTTAVPAAGSLVMSASAISDSTGNLLFYCNGEKCWDRTHAVMPNGGTLLGEEHATQNSMFIPSPGNGDRYYVFTLDQVNGGNGLHYYIVDITFNGGLGDIVSPGTQLDDTLTEKLCATKHANDLDYWVVAHDWGNDDFLAYHIDTFGVTNTPVVSSVGLTHGGFVNAAKGQMKISPDGTRLALANWLTGFVELFDFDPATGQVSNPITLLNTNGSQPFGIEFSVDSRKLYYSERVTGSTAGRIIQYDLDHVSTDCLLASENVVGQMDNAIQIPSNLQLGLNGSIYMSSNYFGGHDSLSVIYEPALFGVESDFVENHLAVDSGLTEGLTSFISTYMAGGIHVKFATTCDSMPTVMFPEDSLHLDSVRWNFGDPITGIANTSTSIEASHIFSSPDTFAVTLYSYRGTHADTFMRDVIIWDTAVNLLGNDTTLCDGNNVSLAADWYDACYEWSTGSTNNSITTNTAGWYWVDVYHQSCLFRDSVFVEEVADVPQFSLGGDTSVCLNVNLVLDPNLTNVFYTWQDGSHAATFNVNSTGIYSLTASNACGSSVDSINIFLNQQAQPVVNFPDDTLVCDSVTFELDVTFENAVYSWSDGSTQGIKEITENGTYWVEIGNVCDTVSDTVDIVFEAPLESALDLREVVCDLQDSLNFLGVVDSSAVTWSDGSSGTIIKTSEPGPLWFTAQNACGLLSDTIDLLLWDTAFSINLGNDTTVCDDTKSFTLGYTEDAYPFDYAWSIGETSATIDVGSGIYSLSLTNRCATIEDEIRINTAEPIAIQDVTDTVICEGQTVRLALTDQNFASATWSNNGTGAAISITDAGTYSVIVTDLSGCTFSDSISFDDLCPPLVFVPNVFTANSDGINDEFCMELENISSAHIHIFNRWGMEVYESEDMDACWDGKFAGNTLDEGVYYYIVNVLDNAGSPTTFKGSLTLLR